ncbi:hypothetical protein PSHT_11499 [Puccinia striiformis]|uniref:GPR1/FUN34/yaaH family protein n=1 Tax=Puccinia striiformis TaxID=27350 RepID=A0A2S4V2Z8_9BASI|nr:hypothetical protein PSHT_11499 [Puccinia striiformis]
MKQDSCDAITLPNPRPMTLASSHSDIIHHCPGSYVTTTAPRKVIRMAALRRSSMHATDSWLVFQWICAIVRQSRSPRTLQFVTQITRRVENDKQDAEVDLLHFLGFATTTFLLSLFNLQTRGIKTESLIISMAFAYGGIIQVLAGMWEFACGNTFGATAFSSYGGFWISSGILAAYATKKDELESALGLYLFSWFIFTTIMLLGSLRTSVALVALFFFLDVTFLLLAIGKLSADTQALTKAGGVFGVITAFIAWYVAAAGLLEAENSFIRLPTIPLGDLHVDRDLNDRKD